MNFPLDTSKQSIKQRLGDTPDLVIETITQRYIGQNPKVPFQFRAFNRAGILQNNDGLFIMDFSSRFPHSRIGDYTYVWGKVWSDSHRGIDIEVTSLGITDVYVNNQLVPVRNDTFVLELIPGCNHIILRCEKTVDGFGCLFGSKEAMVRLLNILHPMRQGEAGWSYCSPIPKVQGISSVRDMTTYMKNINVHWYPTCHWTKEEKSLPIFQRLFGFCPDHYAYAWTQLKCSTCDIQLTLEKKPVNTTIYVDETQVNFSLVEGLWVSEISLTQGIHNLIVESQCKEGDDWGFILTPSTKLGQVELTVPLNVKGSRTPWLYIGPLVHKILSFDNFLTQHCLVEDRYWQLNLKDTWVRPYYENSMLGNKWTTSPSTNYARWDYPLGVTLRGILHGGKQLNRQDYIEYVKSHIEEACSMYHYGIWDSKQYGYPSLNHQLTMMKMLDHCGSFGSTLLETMTELPIENGDDIAKKISSFMSKDMERTKENAFYRRCEGEYLENTIWADDLYMCGPFLMHYYQKTGDDSYLEDVIHQFLTYKEYLFMEEQKLLSHVYDFKCNSATHVPWGRGNGWVFFSLSLLLEIMPQEHKDYGTLKDYFSDLAYSYLQHQHPKGLWHQVINVADSYLETSCTAMFLYGLCKAITNNILDESVIIELGIERAWQGLINLSIDEQGNIHGVCPGSKYAFTPEYYMKELLPVSNDNHGIGIVLLSAIEYAKYRNRK